MVCDDAEVDPGPPESHGRIPGLVAKLYLGFRRERWPHGGKDLLLRQPGRDEVSLCAVLDGVAQGKLLGDADRRLDVVQTMAVHPERHRPVQNGEKRL